MIEDSEPQVEELYTLSRVFNEKHRIGGKTHNQQFLKRVVSTMGIEPDGKVGTRQSDGYYLATLEDAYNRFQMQYGDLREVTVDGDGGMDSDLVELKKKKIRKEIEQLERDITKRDLTIEQLKNKLVDYEEAYKYLASRKAIEGAVLRRIFLTHMPIDLPGADMAKARKKGEEYYNSIMSVCNETVNVWKKNYNTDGEFEAAIEKIVRGIEEKIKNASKETPQSNLGSSNSVRPEVLPTDRPQSDSQVG